MDKISMFCIQSHSIEEKVILTGMFCTLSAHLAGHLCREETTICQKKQGVRYQQSYLALILPWFSASPASALTNRGRVGTCQTPQ